MVGSVHSEELHLERMVTQRLVGVRAMLASGGGKTSQ